MKTRITEIAAAVIGAFVGTSSAEEVASPAGVALISPPLDAVTSSDHAGTAPRPLFSVIEQAPLQAANVAFTEITYLTYADKHGPEANGSDIKIAFLDSIAGVVCVQEDRVAPVTLRQAMSTVVPYECRDVTTLSAAFAKGIDAVKIEMKFPEKIPASDFYPSGRMDSVNVNDAAPDGAKGNIHAMRWDLNAKEIISTFVQVSPDGKMVKSQTIATQELDVADYVAGVASNLPEKEDYVGMGEFVIWPPLPAFKKTF